MRSLGSYNAALRAWSTTDGAGLAIVGCLALVRGLAYILTDPETQAPIEALIGNIWSGIIWLLLAFACLRYAGHWRKRAATWVAASAVFLYAIWGASYMIAWLAMSDTYPRAYLSAFTLCGTVALLLWAFSRNDRQVYAPTNHDR